MKEYYFNLPNYDGNVVGLCIFSDAVPIIDLFFHQEIQETIEIPSDILRKWRQGHRDHINQLIRPIATCTSPSDEHKRLLSNTIDAKPFKILFEKRYELNAAWRIEMKENGSETEEDGDQGRLGCVNVCCYGAKESAVLQGKSIVLSPSGCRIGTQEKKCVACS